MKGDLSTLKKACLYGSKVMAVGTAVLGAIIIALIILGACSLFSDAAADALRSIMGLTTEDPSEKKACLYLGMLTIFALAVFTVGELRSIMASIHSEHSPFTETNTSRAIAMSKAYVIGAVILGAVELAGGFGPGSAAFMFFGCILLSVVLYMFALIIRYGSVLQNESDHTL